MNISLIEDVLYKKINVAEFCQIFESDANIAIAINNYYKYVLENNLVNIDEIDINKKTFSEYYYFYKTTYGIVGFYSSIYSLLYSIYCAKNKGIPFCKDYLELYGIILQIVPDYLDCSFAEDLALQFWNEISTTNSNNKCIQLCKTKLKNAFHIEGNHYPRWVQAVEWPIKNMRPLWFKEQKRKKGTELVEYYFYDPDNLEEIIIKQYY